MNCVTPTLPFARMYVVFDHMVHDRRAYVYTSSIKHTSRASGSAQDSHPCLILWYGTTPLERWFRNVLFQILRRGVRLGNTICV